MNAQREHELIVPSFVDCPWCDGRGEVETGGRDYETNVADTRLCGGCDGDGIVDATRYALMTEDERA